MTTESDKGSYYEYDRVKCIYQGKYPHKYAGRVKCIYRGKYIQKYSGREEYAFNVILLYLLSALKCFAGIQPPWVGHAHSGIWRIGDPHDRTRRSGDTHTHKQLNTLYTQVIFFYV